MTYSPKTYILYPTKERRSEPFKEQAERMFLAANPGAEIEIERWGEHLAAYHKEGAEIEID